MSSSSIPKSTGGVEDNDAGTFGLGLFHTVFADGDRIAFGWIFVVNRAANLFTDDFQLLDSRGTLEVGSNENRRKVLLLQHFGQLAAGRGLTTTLQTTHHDDGDPTVLQRQVVIACHEVDQSLVYDLDDLLVGLQRLQDIRPDRFFRDVFDEVLHDIKRNVGLKQSRTDLLHAVANVAFRDLPGSPESGKSTRQTFCNTFKHEISQTLSQTNEQTDRGNEFTAVVLVTISEA